MLTTFSKFVYHQLPINLVAMAGLFFAASTPAHDFWIEPDVLRPAADDTVTVRLREGVDFKGTTLPYINEWFQDFSTVDASGRTQVVGLRGDDPAAMLTMPEGALLIGYESNRAFTELPAEKFNSYLEDEGIEFVRELRQAEGTDDMPAPEYFVRCAKALLQSSKTTGDVYATRLGYRLELIPERNPYELAAGDSLTFTLYLRDQPAAGLLVQAYTRDAPEQIQKIRTDDQGRATINLDSSGVWMVKAVNIQSLVGSPQAKWLSHWASYLFELP